jgi:GR25 family glycosyltransferase involved in LPS biosynthesis
VNTRGFKKITDWFDRVYVINRPDRPRRLERFLKHITGNELADRHRILVYPGIMGERVSHPKDFIGGAGAWGCFRSHSNIIESVIMEREIMGEGLESILVLEDDVEFIHNPLAFLNHFMCNLPPDWDQIYLGGQHRAKPLETEYAGVLRGISVNRAHAYALNRKVYKKFYSHINYSPNYYGKKNHHFDHQLEVAHRRQEWNVYCPSMWLAGQCAGKSDICNDDLESRIWH